MRIAVVGATGRVGRRLVAQALERGHQVVAVVRDPDALPDELQGRVEARAADVLDPDAVVEALKGVDAVAAALGGGTLEDPGRARSQGLANVAAAMEALGIARLAAVGGRGSLDHPEGGLRAERPGFPEVFRAVTAEHRRAWEAVRDTPLEWTLVCPPDIPDGPPVGGYRVAADVHPQGTGTTMATGDLAAFMLDALESGAWAGKRVGIGYPEEVSPGPSRTPS